jgi:DNA-binding transcriptional ArsR family regulator
MNEINKLANDVEASNTADSESSRDLEQDLIAVEEKETAYHCTATWHLARMTKAASLIYSLACVISKDSGQFFCSAPNLAQYLGYERKQIYRGLRELEDAGFLELLRSQSFQSSVYRVVLHKEWAESNPESCASKHKFPWDGEGDELGRKMFAISGGRHRFLTYQIGILRKSGISEAIILEEWQKFTRHWKPLNRQDARYFFSRFYDVLKVRYGNPGPLELLIFHLYQISGYVFSGSYKSSLIWLTRDFSDTEIVERFRDHLRDDFDIPRAIRSFCSELSEELSRDRIIRRAQEIARARLEAA